MTTIRFKLKSRSNQHRLKFTVYDVDSANFLVDNFSDQDFVLICHNSNASLNYRRCTIYFDKKTKLYNVNCNDYFTLSFETMLDAVSFIYVN